MLGGGGDAAVLTAPCSVPSAAIIAFGATASGVFAPGVQARIAMEAGGLGGGGGGAGLPHEHIPANSAHAGVNLCTGPKR